MTPRIARTFLIFPPRSQISVLGLFVLLASSCTSPPTGLSRYSVLRGDFKESPDPAAQPEPTTYFKPEEEGMGRNRFLVKTTAYCHWEADSLPYANLSACGIPLRSTGSVRSAAADWSRYPLGTRFRIIGSNQVYEVDDYGGALVGTDRIDLYQSSLSAMRNWGAPVVGVEILKWGSIRRSIKILGNRVKTPYVRRMWKELKTKSELVPEELLDGFEVSAVSESPAGQPQSPVPRRPHICSGSRR